MNFWNFLLKRFVQGVIVLFSAITIVFLLRAVTPGNPVDLMVGFDASQEVRDAVARDLGLHQPIYIQYLNYVGDLLAGDFGYSYISGTSVRARLLDRLPASIELAVAAFVIAVTISIPLGIISATRRQEPADYLATMLSLVGISTPNFWLGIMLVLVASVQFNLFPTSQRPIGLLPAVMLLFDGNTSGIVTWVSHIVLPAVTLGTYFTALLMRLTRNGMIDELGKNYVPTLRSKGLPKTLILYKHVLRNTLIPIVTVMGLQLGTLIGGAVVVEAVFAWPGLGTLIINAVNTRDWPLIQGSLILVGTSFIIINFVVDTLYAYINPQVKYQ